jgi:hypothetical protein
MNFQAQAQNTAKKLNLKMIINSVDYKKHFDNDTEKRHVFNLTLKKERKQYTFNFGQSIAQGSNEPTMYDVLTCLQKYDVGTFEDFCGDFGYDNDSRRAEKIYKAVCKEYQGMQRLFTESELNLLSEIQ